MTGNRWGSSLLIFLVALVTSVASAHAGNTIYLYDESVVPEIDLNAYLTDGTLKQPNGGEFPHWVETGPAPSEYPAIAIAEPGIEILGTSSAQIDGVRFVNHARFMKPDKKTLVLWMIRIPNANQRTSSEFGADINLSLFVDWDQDTKWSESERTIQKSLTLAGYFPTTFDDIYIYYLTSIIVPDVTMSMASTAIFGNSGKELRYMWARAVLSCDDPDASADGEQLFGEYEDYRLAYRVAGDDTDDTSRKH